MISKSSFEITFSNIASNIYIIMPPKMVTIKPSIFLKYIINNPRVATQKVSFIKNLYENGLPRCDFTNWKSRINKIEN